jgi:thioredoxin reductase (NADPH)
MEGREVFVAGAANSAGQAAVHLSRFARRVVILARGRGLSASMSRVPDPPDRGDAEHHRGDPRRDRRAAAGNGRLEDLFCGTLGRGTRGSVPGRGALCSDRSRAVDGLAPVGIRRDRWGFIATGSDLLEDGKLPEGWPLRRAPLPLETSIPGVVRGR